MVIVGGRRAEQTQDCGICSVFLILHIFGEVFVDLVPEGCPNPLGFWFWAYGALPIGPYRVLYRAL